MRVRACSKVTPGLRRAMSDMYSLVRRLSEKASGVKAIGVQISACELKKSWKPGGMTPTTW